MPEFLEGSCVFVQIGLIQVNKPLRSLPPPALLAPLLQLSSHPYVTCFEGTPHLETFISF